MVTGPTNATTTKDGRWYTHPITGERFVSVTTALAGVPKPFLVPWAAKVVAENAVANVKEWVEMEPEAAIKHLKAIPYSARDTAAEIGTAIHQAAFAYASADLFSWDKLEAGWTDEERPSMHQFVNFLQQCNPVFDLLEVTVINRQWGFAGSLDAAGWLDGDGVPHELVGKRLIIDYKTGKAVYPEAALQIAAYANAEVILADDGVESPMLPIEGAAVLHLRPDGWQLFPVKLDQQVFRSFLNAIQVHRWMNVYSKDVLGEPMRGAA